MRKIVKQTSIGASIILLVAGILSKPSFAKKTGEAMYASSTSEVYLDNTHTKAIGMLEIGAKVHVTQKKNGWCEVNIKGWQQKGLTSVIYAFMGKRIVKVDVTPTGEKFIKILSQKKDPATHILWKEVELPKVWVNCSVLVKNQKKIWDSIATLFHERCSMCHALPRTTTFTANQWPATLRVMTKRAALDRIQTDEVSKFLQYHARDTINLKQP